MAVEWSQDVNKDFYGMTRTTEENVITTKFESGKERLRLKNSVPKMVFSVQLALKTWAEERSFWEWYDSTLLSRTETVNLPDFMGSGITKEYRMTEEPSGEGIDPKTLTLTFKEV